MPIYWLSGTLTDEIGGETSFRYQGEFTDDLAADAGANNLLAQLDLLTSATFSNVTLAKEVLFVGVAGAGSRVFEEAFIAVETDGVQGNANVRIPAPNGAVFVPNTNIVDITLPALTGYIALFTGADSWTISDGEKITALKRGKRRFVRSGKTNLV